MGDNTEMMENKVKMWENTEQVHVPEWIPDTINSEHKSQLTHFFKAFSRFQKLQKTNALCDVTIKVEDTSFQAHKVVLAACSEFFSAMFTSGFQESHRAEAVINGKPEAFQILLDFAYSGKVTLTMKTVLDVLKMAHYIQFDIVMERCESFLSAEVSNQRVDVVGVIELFSVADKYNFEKLSEECQQYLTANFRPNIGILEHMTPGLMEKILERTDLTDETEVFDTTVTWLKHDWAYRKAFAPALFQRIRLGTIPVGHLSMTALDSPELYAIPECKAMIKNVMKTLDSHTSNSPPLYIQQPSIFATRTTVTETLCFDKSAKYYDTKTRKWIQLKTFPPLPKKDADHNNDIDSCINVEGHLFVARGTGHFYGRSLQHPQFLKLDISCKQWHTLTPMISKRSNYPLVHLNGYIYAIGGTGTTPQSCEVYSINENNWHEITSMRHNCSLYPISAIVFDSMILVYGADAVIGRIGAMTDHFLQMYNPALDTWFDLMTCNHPWASTSHESISSGLVIHDGKCFRIVDGGCACREDGCQWHELSIYELLIDFNARRATIGEKQDQALIPAKFKKRAFRINEDVYVISKQKYHKTGIKIASNQVDPVNLDDWEEMKSFLSNVTTFTFDKASWM